MSQRDGHATGGADGPPRPADARPPGYGSDRTRDNPNAAPHLPHGILDPTHRQEPSPAAAGADRVHLILQQALSGRLPPAPLADAATVADAGLDDAQRDAALRAAQSPDLFLLRGPGGTGKTRVAAEVVRQAAARGGRVLFLSPDPVALDELLPGLAGSPGLAVVRRLGPGESADRLPPAVAALTPGGRQSATREALVRRAADDLALAEARVRRAEALRPVWDELTAIRARQAARAAEQAALAARRDRLADDVAREATDRTESAPFHVQRLRGLAAAFAKRTVGLDERAAELRATRTEAEERHQTADAECRRLRPKVEALRAGRWYSPRYWMAKLDKDLAARLAAAEGRVAMARTALDELSIREQKLAADRRLAEEEHAADRARLIEAEVARRRAALDEHTGRRDREAAADRGRDEQLLTALRHAGVDPSGGLVSADAELDAARRHLEVARGSAAEVQSRTDDLVREACARVDVVAGPVAGIAADADLGGESFDLLLVDDAHKLTEAELLAAAPLADRWVLVGESGQPSDGRTRNSSPDLFARLAAALPHEVWVHDGSRLVCRLHPVRGTDRRRLECEPVVDSPDIELRMMTPPGGEPILAEVAFPGQTSPDTAREYVCRELGEVTFQPCARTADWEDSPTGPVLRFGPTDTNPAFAAIGPGIREELAGLETRAIHFGPDWSMDRAKGWAAEHVGRRDPGRIVTLTKPYRACPGLARWLNRAFSSGFAVAPTGDDGPHVEFLAVPDTDPRRHRRDHGRPGRVGGAGYEIDLSDARQRAALPAELADLPAAGFVNVPEAQALVRYLEPLAGPNVAVTSPFPSQAAVLRKLLARSPRLAVVRVVEPGDAARCECDLLAVSLTRSHVARAVPFGEAPAVLAGLLARARKKVLFAGDPGTLARRLQWEGPVDHLDAVEAARERAWVAALADCPRVTGPRPRPSPADRVWS
ncbi:MAG TPA: AAA domain-containing protein [Gemmataceae bacterium]|nr:AAA domain-containing protein [Gemmataceae bacterium]